MASSGEGRLRRLGSVGGYVLAQVFFLFAVLQTFLDRGVDSWLYIVPDVVIILAVFVLGLFPALLVGAVDGVSRSLRPSRWVAPLRIVAFLLVAVLALGITLVAWFFLAFTDSSLWDETPLPFGTYLGALAGMEAALGVSWGTRVLTERIFRKRRRVREERR